MESPQPVQLQGDILVIDNDHVSLSILSMTLEKRGYQVRSASNGETALRMARDEPPDLILLDVVMPGMNGYEVCKELKRDFSTRDIPVIFVSVLDEASDKVKGLEVGGVDYITKPLTAAEILARVKTHLTLRGLLDVLERRNEELQQEIAERIKAEEEASYERDLMQALLDNTQDYIYFKDRDRRFVRASNAFCKLFDCSMDEILGKVDEELLSEDLARVSAENDRLVIETGEPIVNREEGGSIDGEENYLLTSNYPWYDKEGNIIGLFGISRDITERWHIGEALRESEEKFRNLAEQSPNMIFINQKGRVIYANEKCTEVIGLSREEFYSPDFDFYTIVAPEYLDLIKTNVNRHMRGEDISAYEFALITKEGDRVEAIIAPKVIRYGGEDAILGIVTDVTEHVLTTKALRRHIEELSALNQIAQILTSTFDPMETLGNVAEIVADLFSARITLFALPDSHEDEFQILAGFEKKSGPSSALLWTVPLAELPITRQLLGSRKTEILHNIQAQDMPEFIQSQVNELDLQVALFVPLKTRGEFIGSIIIGFDDPERKITAAEISLGETIASDIAGVIDNARLVEQAQVAAVDAERQRLARALHDSVTQSLYSLTLLSSGWESMAEQGTLENTAESFHQLGEVGQQALKEMRLLIHQLRPSILEEVGLVQALQQRLDIVELRANIEARLLTKGEVANLPSAVEDQLFYIAQEALNNSIRHSGASEVIVQLQVEDDRIILSVEDDGKGFDPTTDTTGMGLENMRERTEAIHGNITIDAGSEKGTKVLVSVPLEREEQDRSWQRKFAS